MGKKNKDAKVKPEKKSGKKDKQKSSKQSEKSASAYLDEIKRLNRISGQIEGISKMLHSGRKLHEVVTQFKAVRSALSSVEQRVFETYVSASVEDIVAAEKRKERDQKLDELKKLYKAA